MKYMAVIFDLFGTLADNFSSREYEEALIRMSSVLSLPPDDFKRGWYESSIARDSRAPKGLEDRIDYICTRLGVTMERSKIDYAAKVRLDYIRHVMEPRTDAIKVLLDLKENGYKLGLISDCSDEIPVIWPETPFARLFDARVFSCLVGFRKPDPRIYELGSKRINVPLDRCLYIGDGGSQELFGALKAGMQAVLFRLDAKSSENNLSSREPWDGKQIHSIREVLSIIAED
jgi:putative hydrolase of the HAD superfamily